MKKLLLGKNGNAMIVAVIAGALGIGGLTFMLSQVSNLSRQMAQSDKAAQAGDELTLTLAILQKKFSFPKRVNPEADSEDPQGVDALIYNGLPDWVPDYSAELDPDHPFIAPAVTAPSDQTSYVSDVISGGFKSESGNCVSYMNKAGQKKGKGKKKEQVDTSKDCQVVELGRNKNGISALQKKNSLSETDNVQNGVVGIKTMANLTSEEKINSFSPGFVFPLNKLGSVPIRFLKFVNGSTEHPQAVTGVIVEVNDSLAEIPIEPPPPPTQCEIALKNPSLEPIDLSSGNVNLLFDVQANSLVESVSFHNGPDDGELLGSYSKEQLDPQSLTNFGTLTSLKAAGFSLSLSNDETDIPSPDTPNEALKRISVTLTGLSSIPTDQMVDGSPVMRSSQTCAAIIRTKKPSPPLCHLKVTNSASVKITGDVAKLSLDCSSPKSGIITSAIIAGNPVTFSYSQFKERQVFTAKPKQIKCEKEPDMTVCSASTTGCTLVKRIQGYKAVSCSQYKDIYQTITTTDLSLVKSPKFLGTYKRQTDGQAEVITASATGPGGTWTGQVGLGELCPYQDPDYSRQEFAYGLKFKDAIAKDNDKIENAIADLEFTTGLINYTSHGTYWKSSDAKSGSVAGVLTKKSDGSWNGDGGNWDKAEPCDATNICMKMVQMSNNKYNAFKGGGKAYWVEVGPKSSASCSVIKTKMRHGGCFAGSTKLRMADGTEKAVSQIGENQWLYNPHYHAPVRVKSVVKGPEKKPLFEVSYANQKVVVTEDHPFLTRSGWVQAMDLKAGAILVGAGTGKEVKKVRQLAYKKAEDVWNFELDTEDPMGHLVLANEIPTGDLITQQLLKKEKHKLP